MPEFPLKPSHKPVTAYFAALAQFQKHGHTTEGNTRSAFADLLKKCASPYGWHLVEEFQFRGTAKQKLRADGALIDELTLQHGIWEAKDNDDDLEAAVKKKRNAGYPIVNTLFQSPSHAILYQRGRVEFDEPITTPEKLVKVLEAFFSFEHEHERDWEEAVIKFSKEIPEIARVTTETLANEAKTNANFRERFASFADLARHSINPDLSDESVNKMLVQHLLTERIFRKVFNNPEFTQRNVIAAEIEKVIASITARHFSRDAFLKKLDRFYIAIEKAAEQQEGYTEKQHFLNAVYEKFFQSFDRKQADTHGIVYTPQPIVDFMVRSIEEILQQEFGKSLSDKGVHILDPFTGTGNFVTRIMQSIKRSALPHKYAHELHCNEVMLLPYYIASMNIEHAYMERAAEYRPFEGICLVDTFELAEPPQGTLFSEENSKRVDIQKGLRIEAVIGNPPYNVGQDDENDSNANRKYPILDERVKKTYIKGSQSTLTMSLWDPYVKAFRWASDRIATDGVVCFVSNNSFLDDLPFDQMRAQLARDFTSIYVIDLGGNVRKNTKLSGTTHNVFGIQVGVTITLLVKRSDVPKPAISEIFAVQMPEYARRAVKYEQLDGWNSLSEIPWKRITPNSKHRWFYDEEDHGFYALLPLAMKRLGRKQEALTIFRSLSNGVKTNNDPYVYGFDAGEVSKRATAMVQAFTEEQTRWRQAGCPSKIESFLRKDLSTIKWIRRSKKALLQNLHLTRTDVSVRRSLYRPFTKQFLNFTKPFNEDSYSQDRYVPSERAELENKILLITTHSQSTFTVQVTNLIACQDVGGRPSQTFPFYTYDRDGAKRSENITDWALAQFADHYADQAVTKWDIFHATYAVLHHQEYRSRYGANLKRELPRIPFPPDFHTFAAAGKRLMELHIDYEQQLEYPLQQIESEDKDVEVSFRVTRMKLSKDKTELRYNDFLLLRGIPPAVFEYRLGNRSALEWVIDQYRVTTDSRSGIINDPNREDDPKYILRLVGQVISVSLETNQIIASLPSLGLPAN